jgi:excisionase family DNA binding protein
MTGKILMTPIEAADVLSISRSVIYELIAKGVLRSLKIGRSRRVLRTSVEEFVNREIQNQIPAEESVMGESHIGR